MEGQSLLLTFRWAGIPAFGKVSRCKSETISSHYRSNGYVHHQKLRRLSQSHREQARLPQVLRSLAITAATDMYPTKNYVA